MIIIDESYKEINDKMRGRKPKIKFQKGKEQYIFKYGAINYEIWSELIAEQLGKQIGIEMAHYEVAEYKGVYGLLTKNFLKEGELIISSDNLKKSANFIISENSLGGDLKCNTIIDIIQASYICDNRIITHDIGRELMKRWAFITLLMESDKNETNIGFIKGQNGMRLTPDYDNATVARLNENINNFIDTMKTGYFDIRTFTDDIKNSLGLTDESNGLFWHDFPIFAKKYPQICLECLELFEKINIDKAIEDVEKINSVQVPWEVKFWLSKTINARLEDMNAIFKQTKLKNK